LTDGSPTNNNKKRWLSSIYFLILFNGHQDEQPASQSWNGGQLLFFDSFEWFETLFFQTIDGQKEREEEESKDSSLLCDWCVYMVWTLYTRDPWSCPLIRTHPVKIYEKKKMKSGYIYTTLVPL
jgi:hypothetical protein